VGQPSDVAIAAIGPRRLANFDLAATDVDMFEIREDSVAVGR